MKKYLLGISFMMGCASLWAQTFTEFPTDEEIQLNGGCQVTGMSTNGKYILGGTYHDGGFVYDVDNGKLIKAAASGISHDGMAVAGLSLVNLKTGQQEGRLESPGNGYQFIMTTGISGDGHVVTGTAGQDWTQLIPICWVDGKLIRLPYPATEEVGTFKVNGCRANGVSDDGSVIWGNFIANPNTNLLIIWERQPDGSYGYVDTWTDLYEPQHGWVYDYDTKEYSFVCGPNPYCRMEPYAMSGDGNLILIRTQQNTEEESPPNRVGIFHVPTRTLELAPWDKDDLIGKARDFDSRGIANDGTVVGIARENTLSDAVPFIMFPGEGPQYLNDAFPEIDRLYHYEDCAAEGLPYLLTVISEDARYIAGYSTDYFYYENEGGVTSRDFCFHGYVIDLKPEGGENEDSAVEKVGAENENMDRYYTIDGIKVDRPSHGLYIRRGPDGRSSKVIL